MRVEGLVVQDRYAPGSKSEHNAVMLQTTDKQRYLLRRLGGNPFYDKDLVSLVGKSIIAEGDLRGQTLIMSSWQESPG